MRSKTCPVCGNVGHTKTFCRMTPNKPIKRSPIKRSLKPIPQESKKSRLQRKKTAAIWFKYNPADENGNWECWLQISTLCPKILNRNLLTLEHVYPKIKFPEFKYNYKVLKPACAFCNKLKGSNTPEQLAIYFVNIAILIQKPEWKAWKATLFAVGTPS